MAASLGWAPGPAAPVSLGVAAVDNPDRETAVGLGAARAEAPARAAAQVLEEAAAVAPEPG
jgi:hypothetical protein